MKPSTSGNGALAIVGLHQTILARVRSVEKDPKLTFSRKLRKIWAKFIDRLNLYGGDA
jgi:hypothetical protein